MNLLIRLIAFLSIAITHSVFAEPVTYNIDPSHTFPAFEADHQGGLSVWRGKINSSSGTVVMDREAETGRVDITMDITSIDFGHDGMNSAATEQMLNVTDYPTAVYSGELTNFVDGEPTAVEGTLTLNGVSNSLDLSIEKFLCKPHFQTGREVCGADASSSFSRADYGVDFALNMGFLPYVNLNISIEAQAAE